MKIPGVTISHTLSIKDICENNIVAVSIPKEAVDAMDFKRFDDIYKKFEKVGREARNKMAISFDGYEDTPDEIYTIPEIRRYVEKLFNKYPHLLYFLCTEGPMAEVTIIPILACIADTQAYRHKGIEDMYQLKVEIPVDTQFFLIDSAVRYGIRLGEKSDSVLDKLHHVKPLYVLWSKL